MTRASSALLNGGGSAARYMQEAEDLVGETFDKDVEKCQKEAEAQDESLLQQEA